MQFMPPPQSKSAVKKASRELFKYGSVDLCPEKYIKLIDHWRVSHAYVLNTFQAWMRNKIKAYTKDVEFAQRLKRKRTVIDKILSKRGLDISSMHDIAGCRLIFKDINDLYDFRNNVIYYSKVKHKHKHGNNVDKYNYIKYPKPKGYRAIHDIFKHYTRSSPTHWDGLLVELQYRTYEQHAWATAVEIVDLIKGTRSKFDNINDQNTYFFKLASEIIARHYEASNSCLPDLPDRKLEDELMRVETETNLLSLLKSLRQKQGEFEIGKHTVLNIDIDNELITYKCKNSDEAIKLEEELFYDNDSIDAVYVQASNPNVIKSAYRNYFMNPVQFVDLIEKATNIKEHL